MSQFARETTVSPERSRAEIEQILGRYGAEAFAYATDAEQAHVGFRAHGRAIRFRVPLPAMAEVQRTPKGRIRHGHAKQEAARQQAVRQRWRALSLCIKAKLEAVASGIETFDEAFLSHMDCCLSAPAAGSRG